MVYSFKRIFFLLIIISLACNKNDEEFATSDHSVPESTDLTLVGTSSLTVGEKIYVYFSKLIFPKFSTDFWYYHSPSKNFYPLADFPGPDRLNPYLINYDKTIFAGLNKVNASTEYKDWHQYDTTANTWKLMAPSPKPIPTSMGIRRANTQIVFGCEYPISGLPVCPLTYLVTNNTWIKETANCDAEAKACF